MGTISVQTLDVPNDGAWSFRTSTLDWRHGGVGVGVSATFDPFPAYPHDLDVVTDTVQRVLRACPALWDLELYVADREEVGRSNGFSALHRGHRYEDGQWVEHDPTGLIMLGGKRTPIHPGVTRYLVAHEYGHNMEWMLNRMRGQDIEGDTIIEEYAEVRDLTAAHKHDGTGGRWHDSSHEIFACDFRILVCDVETEFWPHPGIARPEDVWGLRTWWTKQAAMLADHDRVKDSA